MRRFIHVIAAGIFFLLPQASWAQQDQKWVVSWAASAHGPYPVGNPSAQPDQKFAFPSPPAGANDQTFRLIVRPDIWGRQARLRFTNAFGTKPITFDGTFMGLQLGGPGLVKGTNRPVTFGGKESVTVAHVLHWAMKSPPASSLTDREGAAAQLLLECRADQA